MTIIGYYGMDKDDMEMFCLKCANEEMVGIDVEDCITADGYPDGFLCAECWGTVTPDGAVTNRAGEQQ